MSLWKLFIFFIIFQSASLINPRRRFNFEPYIRYTGIKCWSSNSSISSYTCFIKSYSRDNSTLNICLNLTRPIFNVKGRYDMTFKYLTNSQRSIINATLEICEHFNGTISNPVLKWILGMNRNLDRLIHPCPYKVCCSGDGSEILNFACNLCNSPYLYIISKYKQNFQKFLNSKKNLLYDKSEHFLIKSFGKFRNF